MIFDLSTHLGHFDPIPILQRRLITQHSTETVETYSLDIEIYL